MENSFFEYRNKVGVESGSDSEIIDESIIDSSFSTRKTPAKKNHTVFVAESEESLTEDESEVDEMPLSKIAAKKIHLAEPHIISSSDDDGSRRGSIRQQAKSAEKVLLSSSDDEEVSPELVPRKRPPQRPKSMNSSSSFIGRKTKKRMVLLDSDTEDSIIIEHKKHNKLTCLKDTPLKIDDDKANQREVNMDETCCDDASMTEDESNYVSKVYDTDGNDNTDDPDVSHNKTDVGHDKPDTSHNNPDISHDKPDISHDKPNAIDDNTDSGNDNPVDDNSDSCNDDGLDEDQMLMSRATRMSIMGVVPQNDDSDDSDFIQSDESKQKSRASSLGGSLTDLPDVTLDGPLKQTSTKNYLGGSLSNLSNALQHTPLKDNVESYSRTSLTDLPDVSIPGTPSRPAKDCDSSRISCSPFSSPGANNSVDLTEGLTKQTKATTLLQDVTNNIDLTGDYPSIKQTRKSSSLHGVSANIDLTMGFESNEAKKQSPVLNVKGKTSERVIDDDITIIDSNPEIIALSSDDEDETKTEKKSPRPRKSQDNTIKNKDESIKRYMVPESYPNQIVYVKESVRTNELNKLESLKQDLLNIRQLLDEVDTSSLPDQGRMLMERLSSIEREVKRQGDKVANMVVEPKNAAALLANNGNAGLSWEQLQMASNAVQPKHFGKQGVATHIAERSMILDRLRDLHASLASCPAESSLASQPAALKSELMRHQKHALAWLQWRETQKPPSGILADDMGLGKTITMIALVASDKENNIDHDDDEDYDDNKAHKKLAKGGTLVVCPASLMQQWGGEVTKHCHPHRVSVCLHHGANRATQPHRLATYDMVVTTYNILQRDNEKNGVLMRVLWRRVILDEAHIVRNHKAATSVAVCSLPANRRCCLTGTPVQNKDLDLFALLKFLRVSPFDQLPMWKKWVDDKSLGGQERLSTIMRSILLRRTKAQLQQSGQLNCLPERTTHQRLVTLTKPEMNVYQKVLVFSKTLFAQFLHQRAEKNADSYGFSTRPDKDSAYHEMHKKMIALQGAKPVKSHEILVLLLRLRQVCCHCGLIAAMLDERAGDVDEDPAGKDLLAELNKLTLDDGRRKSGGEPDKNADLEEESTTVAEAIRSVLSPNNPVFDLKKQSSKIVAVMECLEENVFVNKGHKAVVVSQWTSVLSLVEKELKSRGVQTVTLSGAVPVPARAQLVNKINDPTSDVKIMLLSLCAGGVGLNLCGANHLLLLDPHWNPQLEQQAQDRIYRVGQHKPVHIYRFMCVDTVEQSIRNLQEAKLQLAENVLTGARNTNASKLTIEDLRSLFNMS